jgi:hypothetical protein
MAVGPSLCQTPRVGVGKMSTNTKQRRRRLKGLFVSPSAQLRFYFPYLLITTISSFGILITYWKISSLLRIGMESFRPEQNELVTLLSETSQWMLFLCIANFFTVAIVSYIVSVITSHKIFGAAFAIQRHVAGMRHGDFETQLSLRQGDEFQDIAEELNGLAKSLDRLKSAG